MIEVTDSSKILFKIEPYSFKNSDITPTLEALDLEQVGDFYKVKLHGKNLRAKLTYTPESSFNSYEEVWTSEAFVTSPMEATFYMKVPVKYFSYLADKVKLPYKEEEFDFQLLECNVDDIFDTDDINVTNNDLLKRSVENVFSQIFDNIIYYSISP